MNRTALAFLAAALLYAAGAGADIFRWEDEAGTVHFTDDVSTIPAPLRGKAVRVIREAPRPAEPPPPSRPAGGNGRVAPAPPPEDDSAARARERDDLASEVEQLRAKIAAKENLVRTVEERQNLATNPYRARVLDPGDLDLYKKYREELPDDRAMLKEMESRLESLK